jgi:ligand-binding SRPBCC domain-containing protein
MDGFEVRTTISARADEVWRRVTTPAGINDELMPIVRMTIPGPMRGRTIADVAAGSHLGRNWLLFLGLVPFDYDDIGIAELEPGRRFVERSSMLSVKSWEHERTVAPNHDGCELRDRVAFDLRGLLAVVPGLDHGLRFLLRALFRHRHRRVVRYFGATVRNARTN